MEIRELHMLEEIEHRLSRVNKFLTDNTFPKHEDAINWLAYLHTIKSIQGNFSNDISFVATLLAKEYLEEVYSLEGFNAADKPQGAPGLDIDVKLPNGKHLVAEIKTTSPYNVNDLGAKQKESFRKDFRKLAKAKAEIKLFFVTELRTFDLMKKPKYRNKLTGVRVVLLPSGEEFQA